MNKEVEFNSDIEFLEYHKNFWEQVVKYSGHSKKKARAKEMLKMVETDLEFARKYNEINSKNVNSVVAQLFDNL